MPPPIPTATYRLQLRAGFGFDQAAAVVPYLKALGVSHLYASPFLKARAGSTHGYDIIDHNALNPEFGGEEAFRRLGRALREADIGLILDFVPNHMGVHYADNAWWLDVLEWGPKSSHADSFDIDWETLPFRSKGGILLPILGGPYGEALENGEIELRYDPQAGSFSAWYYEHRLPIEPTRYGEILRKLVETSGASGPTADALLQLAARYRGPNNPTPSQAPTFKADLAAIPGAAEVIERGLTAYRPKSGLPGAALALHHLLERQHYRVAYWRLAGSEINYRRFFDINTLAGLRVEDRATFDAIHSLVGRLIAEDSLQGLRFDHIDGLRDPHQYFRRLQKVTRSGGQRRKIYSVVEKILAEDERLPKFANVAGTTGYEWLNVISHVLVEASGLPKLDNTWQEFSGQRRSFDAILIESKRRVLRTLLASEFTVLTRLLARIAVGHYSTRDYSADSLRVAFELFVLHFPVYRTYITGSGPSARDRALIEGAIEKARASWFGPDAGVFDFLRDVLTLDLIAPGRQGHSRSRVRNLAFKVQQFTGPVMAKSLEDTAFYRYHRLLALNEVGGNPVAEGLSVTHFHDRMVQRAASLPHGMTATATHDTKRGEDARARLLTLSELPDEWTRLVEEWRRLNVAVRDGDARPSAAHEYMLYQALLGAWPLGGVGGDLVERMQAFAVKAAREGKQQTSWLVPDERYENALTGFIAKLLDPRQSAEFISLFGEFAARVALMGALASLTQLVLKAAMPGVPDFYQGTEFWDLSLVDPDNRRPVDFSDRAAALQSIAQPDWIALVGDWKTARIKLALTRELLMLRRRFGKLFTHGSYVPLEVSGPQQDEILAFARVNGRDAIITVVGRRFARASDNGRHWPTGSDWQGSLPLEGFSSVRRIIPTEEVPLSGEVTISKLFDVAPIAILQAEKR
jgi:(1->4)-alpha-D-glucan 1-alpha-D-glucosylmutase